jgi:hypothetical protein
MRLSILRIASILVVCASASFALADQKIKTKSNIKNDRLAEASSSAACTDQKEGSADGKVECKTVDSNAAESKNAASSAPAKTADTPKDQL